MVEDKLNQRQTLTLNASTLEEDVPGGSTTHDMAPRRVKRLAEGSNLKGGVASVQDHNSILTPTLFLMDRR